MLKGIHGSFQNEEEREVSPFSSTLQQLPHPTASMVSHQGQKETGAVLNMLWIKG